MVLKITDLRKQYGINPTFETEDEALAYEQERQRSYEERVAAKVQELKDLYNSNPEKYRKFRNFREDDWIEYAKICINYENSSRLKYSLEGLPSITNDPEAAKWIGFSYEEILQMEANGVLIPKVVLDWAHSMQDSDVTAYEINGDSAATEETEETGVDSDNMEFFKLQKKTQTLSNKSKAAQEETNQNFETFKEIAEKAEQIKHEQETTKKDSLKQIEELTKEWEEISTRVKNGDKLTETEQKRYKELGSLLNGKDGELTAEIQTSSDDLQTLINSMDGLDSEILTNIELGDETNEAAKQLSLYEKSYDRKNTQNNSIIDVTTGDIKNLLQTGKGKDIAKEAIENSNNLIEFSNTLDQQLMMNQYASLYEFAQIFTQTSAETLTNTKEILGDDFNKPTDEINEQLDVTTGMTNAEKERANLEAKGANLPDQATYFKEKSIEATNNSDNSISKLSVTQWNAQKEKDQSQALTDKVVEEMTSVKEEADKLTEKKEKAEENKEKTADAEKLLNQNGNSSKVSQIQGNDQNPDEEEFTEEDQKTLDKLNNQLKMTGTDSQQKLYQALTNINNLEEFLYTEDFTGSNAIDYGKVTQAVGEDLVQYAPNSAIYPILYALGIITENTGFKSEKTGIKNNESYKSTALSLNLANVSIGQNQISIQGITNVEAIKFYTEEENGTETGANEESPENTGEQVDEAQNNEVTGTFDETEATQNTANTGQNELNSFNEQTFGDGQTYPSNVITVGISSTEADVVTETLDEGVETETETQQDSDETYETNTTVPVGNKEGLDNANDKEEVSTDDAENNIKGIKTTTEEENADSIAKKDETEKTEAQLEKEMKNLEKNMQKDQKELEKIAKESEKIMREKQQLAAEFETLNAQNEEIIARDEAKQNSTAAMALPPQGGLLNSNAQENNMAVAGDDSSTLETNQGRIVTISSRFKTLDKKLNLNKTKVRNIGTTSRKRHAKFEKLAKEKAAVIKEYQKKEEAKQAKVEKSLAVVKIANNIFSITMSLGTILMAWPVTFAAGQILFNIGLYGILFCALVKSTVLMANGNFKEAFVTMGMAAIQIATSMVPGAGAAANAATATLTNATQAVGAGLNIVSSMADTAAQGQTLAGKEQSGYLNTVSQVAGAASTLTNIAGGFTKSGDTINKATKEVVNKGTSSAFKQGSDFEKALQISQATGTTLSTTAQIRSIIKQSDGNDPDLFEKILNTIGFSISTAASLGQIGIKISEAAANKKELKNDKANQSEDELSENIDDKQKTEDEIQENKNDVNEVLNEQNPDDFTEISEAQIQETELQDTVKETFSELEKIDAAIDPETQQAIENAQIQDTADEQAVQQVEENQIVSTDDQNEEIQSSNVDNETGTTDKIATDETDEKVEATSQTDNKSEQETNESDNSSDKELDDEEKRQKLDIGKSIVEAGNQGLQLLSAVQSTSEQPETEEQRNVLKLSNMRKGKSLIRKIKKRRKALYGYSMNT